MPRIAIGPGEVAGFFARLKAGLDAHGVASEHFLLAPNRFGYAQNRYFLDRASARALALRGSRLAPLRLLGLGLAAILRLAIFAYAVARYDTFIFNGSWSFFKFRELWLLKLLNKKVIVIFLGSDARPPILCGRHLDDDGDLVDPAAALAETREIHDKVRCVERHADWIVNHTATDQFFTRSYVRFSAIGLPIDANDVPVEPRAEGGAVRIVHAPSRPLAKGSNVFRQIVGELRDEGFEIELVELVGVPNARVLEELRRCDFVLDELYSDTPMAMFATEAAMFGRPTVVGGYYSELYDRHNPAAGRPPTLFVDPAGIKAAVRRMVEDGAFRRELGQRAHDFVATQWNAAAVAGRVLRVVEGSFPADWLVEPAGDDAYVWGWGLSEAYWRQQLCRYVEHNGPHGLMLERKPAVARRIEQVMAGGATVGGAPQAPPAP